MRGSYPGVVRVPVDCSGCRVRLLQGAAAELVVNHYSVPVVLVVDAAGPDVDRLAVTACISTGLWAIVLTSLSV